MVVFACLCLQFFRTDFPTEPLNFVKYFASFFRRNKTKIRCNYWENVKFSKVEQTKLGSNHWFSNTYLRLILMIAYAKIIAFVSFEIYTLFFFFSKMSILWLHKKIAKKFKPFSAIIFQCVLYFEIDLEKNVKSCWFRELKLVHLFLYNIFLHHFGMKSQQFGMKILFTFFTEEKNYFRPIRSLFT